MKGILSMLKDTFSDYLVRGERPSLSSPQEDSTSSVEPRRVTMTDPSKKVSSQSDPRQQTPSSAVLPLSDKESVETKPQEKEDHDKSDESSSEKGDEKKVESPPAELFAVGTVVHVQARPGAGLHPGGVARVTAVHTEPFLSYDVRYVVHRGREKNVAAKFVSRHDLESPPKKRLASPEAKRDFGSSHKKRMGDGANERLVPLSSPLVSPSKQGAVETKPREKEIHDDSDEIPDDWPDAVPVEDRLPLGTEVYKYFKGHGWYFGKVTGMKHGFRLYRVLYTDGDEEDLPHNDILQIVEAAKKERAIPVEDRLPLGTEVYKYFQGHGWYFGKVTGMKHGFRFYRVLYTDGDEEDLPHNDILQLVEAAKKERAAAAAEATTRLKKKRKKSPDNATLRRSSRQRTSTVIVVDGHTIKKDNNYVLRGFSYQYGVAQGQEPSASRKVAPKKKKKGSVKAAASKKLHQPRALSRVESKRLEKKNVIERNVKAKKMKREQFLKHNVEVLRPFLEPKVVHRLEKIPSASSDSSAVSTLYMQPDCITAELRDYQLDGLNWMANMYEKNIGMILGDEMGLGKTLQTIALVSHLKEQFNASGPSLIICPLSVLYSWCGEIKKWAPTLKYLRFHSSNTEALDTSNLGDYDMVITTYEMIVSSGLSSLWPRQHFNLLVLDEGHRIKSAETLISKAVRKIHAENRIILTGTPLANNLVEMWSLLNFLLPDVFTTSQPFAEAFDLTLNVVDPVKLEQAHCVLKFFMLRRLKSEVEKLMPKKIETKVVCPLSNTQIWWYKAILMKDIHKLAGGTSQAQILNNLVMQLRKCCLHPYLFPGAEDVDSTTLEDLVGASGKLAVLDKLLRVLYEKGHRVVLFSQFTSVLDVLDDYCGMRGWNYCRFDGGTSRAKRNHLVNSFNAPDCDKFLFLMSTRSGGMGLNLQTADTCILFDSDWNPQSDIQAMARVHRIGQTKTVHVYRLVTSGTVEERMMERAEKKLYLDTMVTHDGVANDVEQSEGADRLMSLLRFGCNAVFGDSMKSNSLPTDEDIEIITDRNRTEEFSNGKLKGGIISSAKDFDATKELTSSTEFSGIDFEKIREQYKNQRPNDLGHISEIWQKRQRKNRIKMIEAENSGYGSQAVPVLVSNDYDLETGEKSVFQQELSGRPANVSRKSNKDDKKFEAQSFCQACGDGGFLVLCPRCPVGLHLECAGVSHAKELLCCSHHSCSVCGKNASSAGGFLFPCSCCPNAYCEDHLPSEARILDSCERMEELGYFVKNGKYVHCSKQCERVAIEEFDWKRPNKLERMPCPPALDVSSHFGGNVDDSLTPPPEDVILGKRNRTKVKSYAELEAKENKPNDHVSSVQEGTIAESRKISTGRLYRELQGISLKELQERKRGLKRQLFQYNTHFARRHGRMPVKADKEPIRHLYESYNALKSQINLKEQEVRHHLSTNTKSQVTSSAVSARAFESGADEEVQIVKIVPPNTSVMASPKKSLAKPVATSAVSPRALESGADMEVQIVKTVPPNISVMASPEKASFPPIASSNINVATKANTNPIAPVADTFVEKKCSSGRPKESKNIIPTVPAVGEKLKAAGTLAYTNIVGGFAQASVSAKPRPPASAYNLFYRDQKEKLEQEAEMYSLSFDVLSGLIQRRWNNLPSSEAEKYKEMAKADYRRYQHEVQSCRNNASCI